MPRGNLQVFRIVTFVIFIILPRSLEASMFCNMEAREREKSNLRELTSKGASTFFKAVSITAEMFSEIELYHTGGEALKRAATLSGQGLEQIGSAANIFRSALKDRQGLLSVDEALKRLTPDDYFRAAEMAKVSPGSTLAKAIIDGALNKGGGAVLSVCADSIEDLRSPKTSMGRVYMEVSELKLPLDTVLWDAMSQLNATLVRGRLISSIFRAEELKKK